MWFEFSMRVKFRVQFFKISLGFLFSGLQFRNAKLKAKEIKYHWGNHD